MPETASAGEDGALARPASAGAASGVADDADLNRLLQAERKGLRLAILCRTLVVFVGFVWFLGVALGTGRTPSSAGLAAFFAFTAFGVLAFAVIGTRYDRWWLKYALYAADILGLCVLFAIVPLLRDAEVPRIFGYRAYGIYYLLPLLAMACLSLSWRLVAWSGLMVVVGWWSAFLYAISDMERRLSWGDLQPGASAQDYQDLTLSPDFIGTGNRIEETAFVFIASLILALAVYRARRVFFAQLAAEAEREAERATRERITQTLGRYLPEAIASRLIADESALAPHKRHGAVLIMDIRDFTVFAADRDPQEVIATLNGFLADCADLVSAEQGVVVSFTGDGLLAVFNAPLELDDPEAAALRAAKALAAHADTTRFGIRVGLAAGPVAAGSVGSAKRRAFTVYGDTVNRAARLEALAKSLGVAVLMDETVAKAAPDSEALRPQGAQQLRGLAVAVPVWSLERGDGAT